MLKFALQPLMLAAAILAGTAIGSHAVIASDHDDGTTDRKTLNTNLTDLFVYNAVSHTGGTAPTGPGTATDVNVEDTDVVLVMNVNPRSLPQQQYFFNSEAMYEFHVHRLIGTSTVNATIPVGEETADLTLRLQFGTPSTSTDVNLKNRQSITLTKFTPAGSTLSATTGTRKLARTDAVLDTGTITTTPHPFIAEQTEDTTTGLRATYNNDTAIKNSVSIDGQTVEVFAGLREDPFFFDVERFFKVRGALARDSFATKFVKTEKTDFTAGYNVLSIVLKVPRALLAGTSGATTFDIWETIKVRT